MFVFLQLLVLVNMISINEYTFLTKDKLIM